MLWDKAWSQRPCEECVEANMLTLQLDRHTELMARKSLEPCGAPRSLMTRTKRLSPRLGVAIGDGP